MTLTPDASIQYASARNASAITDQNADLPRGIPFFLAESSIQNSSKIVAPKSIPTV